MSAARSKTCRCSGKGGIFWAALVLAGLVASGCAQTPERAAPLPDKPAARPEEIGRAHV